jgi:DNA-directed RNA polymerase subunit alpha
MEHPLLSSSVEIKTVAEDTRRGEFVVEGLYAGYGLTVGNALRRALLSSLPGAAITYAKFKGASHEFTTLPGVKEDIVELTMNLKKVRFRVHTDEPQTLLLASDGAGVVTAADIETNADVEVLNPEAVIATVTGKDTEFEAELTVERGLGYSAVESRKAEKMAIGQVGIDAFFSPVTKVTYQIENMRVGDRTDYNRLKLVVETDGTVSPSSALHKAASILKDHFEKIFGGVAVQEFEVTRPEPKKKSKKAK